MSAKTRQQSKSKSASKRAKNGSKANRKSKDKTQGKPIDKNGSSVSSVWPIVEFEMDNKRKSFKLAKLFLDSAKSKDAKSQASPISWLANESESPETWKQIKSWRRRGLKALGKVKSSKTKSKNHSGLRRLAAEVLEAIASQDQNLESFANAAHVLEACHWIRAIAGHCDYQDWNNCVARILEISQAAESNLELDPAVYQLLAIEVPLAVAFQIPETEDYRGLGIRCGKKLSLAISGMTDHDGWPDGKYLPEFGLLVASWVRCHAMMSKMDLELSGESAVQLEWLVRQVLRMMRGNGTLSFSLPGMSPVTKSFLKFLCRVSNDPSDKALIKLYTGKAKNLRQLSREFDPSNVSEWATAVVLRSQWGFDSPRVAIDYSSTACQVEIGNGVELIAGNAMPSVSLNGVPLAVEEDFELVCQETNDEVQYVELELKLGSTNGKTATLTRQFLLSQTEQFLMVADSIKPEIDSRIDYRCDWPLAEAIEGMHELETREVYLRDKNIQSLVLPLALPEWKIGRSDDRLTFDGRNLSLVQSINGSGLYAPLFFDLNPIRSKLKRTWRQLTVGENLQKVSPDVACAYRVQLDKQQWFFYRVISNMGNRTYLGENFSGEFSFNRFDQKGTVTSLIQIDAND